MSRLITLLMPLVIWAAGCTVTVGLPLAGLYVLLHLLPSSIALPYLIFDPVCAMIEAMGGNPSRYDHIALPDMAVLVPVTHAAIALCVALFVVMFVLHALTPLKWLLQSRGPIARISSKAPLYAALSEMAGRASQRMPSIWVLGQDTINAWAYTAPGGRRAVMFTQGALSTIPPDQLLWLFAHELGHLAHGDAAGSSLWATSAHCLGLLDRLRIATINLCLATLNRLPVLYVLVFPIWLITRIAMLLSRAVEMLLKATVALTSSAWNRRAEYRADAFASHLVGTKPGIALLEHLEQTSNHALADLVGSHPTHARRIARLERSPAHLREKQGA